MIIETDKLRERLDKYYAECADRVDSIKNGSHAMDQFNRMESAEVKDHAIIRAIEDLVCKIYDD